VKGSRWKKKEESMLFLIGEKRRIGFSFRIHNETMIKQCLIKVDEVTSKSSFCKMLWLVWYMFSFSFSFLDFFQFFKLKFETCFKFGFVFCFFLTLFGILFSHMFSVLFLFYFFIIILQ
jgi:hypothetical protein